MIIMPYVRIARPNHWFKNIFMLPGVILVFFFDPPFIAHLSPLRLLLGFLSACLIASSNYVLNEILDSGTDRFHPEKRNRPIPSGEALVSVAYAEWAVLAVAGLAIGYAVCPLFFLSGLLLWVMGILYNVKPIRLKDLPYADVLGESVNNPLRMALGWYATGHPLMPPLSVLLAYWMFGAFLMATKRYAEYHLIGNPAQAAEYRKSFGHYNEERLLESILFYACLFSMFSGVFIVRYRFELVLATPLVAYSMAYYLHLGFKENSPVQRPEALWRCGKLMLTVGLAFVVCVLLLFLDLSYFDHLFDPVIMPLR